MRRKTLLLLIFLLTLRDISSETVSGSEAFSTLISQPTLKLSDSIFKPSVLRSPAGLTNSKATTVQDARAKAKAFPEVDMIARAANIISKVMRKLGGKAKLKKSKKLPRRKSMRRAPGSEIRVKGKIICEHGKVEARCMTCGGSAYCVHLKRKELCRICGGSAYCTHGKRKNRCKECRGAVLCQHGKHKTHCKECGGSSICLHGKRKTRCRECGGSELCKHDKHKAYCRECGGSGICQHGKRRAYCKECGGSAICKHGKHKKNCKVCGGSGYCQHGKQKTRCKCHTAKRGKVFEKEKSQVTEGTGKN